MSSIHLHLDNFNAGEVSPLVASRLGVEKVVNGCRRLRNFIIHPHGPAFRRPGMEDMGAALSSAAGDRSRLVSFQFSAATVFVLEFSAAGLRVWKDGALVTLGAPVSLPYAAGELSAVQFCQVNDILYMTHPGYEPQRLVRHADNDWRIGAVPWRWPALGDENPGSQAVPDQYETVSAFGLTPSLWASGAVNGFATPSNDLATLTIQIVGGTPVAGEKRLIIERWMNPGVWAMVHNLKYTTDYPTSHPILIPGATSDSGIWRVRYRGPSYGAGAKVRFSQVVTTSPIPPGDHTVTKEVSIANPAPAEPDSFVVPAGSYQVAINSNAVSDAATHTELILESRSPVGSGPWSVASTHPLTAPVAYLFTGVLLAATEFRWRYNGASAPGGSPSAVVMKIVEDPFQLSIAVSDPTVGTGRTLTTNRPLFLPGHVGAFWQLTHRRDNAFVELVSTSPAVAATGVLTLTAVSVANQTVTIGSRVYTWVATAAAVANTVEVGASATASRDNLIAAINGDAGAGTLYGSTTAPHADVTAAAGPTGTTVILTARKPGTGAHAIVLTDTMANAAWDDVFMHGGVGANTVISAAQTTGIRIQGKWDVTTYGSWASTLYLERLTAAGTWEFVRSWRANKDRNIAVQGETDGDETLRLRILAGIAAETSTEASPRFILEAADSRTDGLVRITAVGPLGSSGKAVTATCDVVQPCLETTPTYVWTEGAWSTARGFPRAVALHEQRLWFGGTGSESMRLWGSVIADIENFRRTTLDDGSISLTPAAGELNPIQWLQSQGTELLIGTLGDEWTLSGEGNPLTPTNFQFRRQSRFGSAGVAAVLAGEIVAFVQRGGRKVRRIAARSANEPWATADMTVLAEHVALEGIREIAFGSNPNAILWAVTNDGKLLGMTLEVEQNVFGWHVHDTDGLIESVAVVYGPEVDEVWLSVLRGTQRRIERLDPQVFARRWTEHATMIFTDCAQRYAGVPVSIMAGLAHLEGKTVKVLADGAVHPDCVVTGGQITLQAPASQVVVGLPFTSELQPSRRELQTGQGSAQGMLWRVSRVGLLVHASRGGQVAGAPNSRYEALPYESAAGLYSGDLETVIESEARRSVDVTVRTTDPLPLNVGALVLKLDLYGD